MDHYQIAVQRSLDEMERCLKQPIALHALAKGAGFSLWHFHRIFSEYTGESIGTYLRRRRLTAAAEELSKTRRGILEIALEYQFESHAAFTRAFKAAIDSSLPLALGCRGLATVMATAPTSTDRTSVSATAARTVSSTSLSRSSPRKDDSTRRDQFGTDFIHQSIPSDLSLDKMIPAT